MISESPMISGYWLLGFAWWSATFDSCVRAFKSFMATPGHSRWCTSKRDMGFGDGAPVVICCIDALVASSFLPLVVLVAMHMYTDMYTQSCRTTGIALQRFRPVIAGPGPRRGVARMPAACGACGCRGGRREPSGGSRAAGAVWALGNDVEKW